MKSALTPLYTLLLLLLLLASLPSEAHNRSQSFSQWTLDQNQLQMLFTVKAREATRLQVAGSGDFETLLANHIAETVSVRQNTAICAATQHVKILSAKPGYLRLAATFECPASTEQTATSIQIGSFFAMATTHVHYARVAVTNQPSLEYLFTENRQQHEIALSEQHWSSHIERAFTQYTALGIEHIFGGIDHIAFLLALLLLLQRMRDVIWMVSGFTVGHSMTLCLAVLGWVNPNILVVEALIGFTIALVAAENIAARTASNRPIIYAVTALLGVLILLSLNPSTAPTLPMISLAGLLLFTLSYLPLANNRASTIKNRPLLSLAFGLIHGFGFASVLQEIGLPEDQLWSALLGFNIGVELGQLMIVAAAWTLYKIVKNISSIPRLVPDISSALLCGLGLYWFIARSYA
jgi:hypothetical protein